MKNCIVLSHLLAITCLLISCFPQSASQETAEEVICPDCTHTIQAYDESTYTLRDGERLCITTSGHFAGRLNRTEGSELSTICNRGTLSPRIISLGAGYMMLENYGTFQPGTLDIHERSEAVHIVNHAGARINAGAINLRGNSSSFHNYGTFSPASLTVSAGASLINHPSGRTTSGQVRIRSGGKVENRGSWVLTGTFDRDEDSSFENLGEMQLANVPQAQFPD